MGKKTNRSARQRWYLYPSAMAHWRAAPLRKRSRPARLVHQHGEGSRHSSPVGLQYAAASKLESRN